MPKKHRPPVNLAQLAARLAGQQQLWRPLLEYDPISRYYARLASEPGFEAWLLTWVPGQGTEWHDHGGSAGAFITVQGTLTELHATVRPDADPSIVRQPRELTTGTLRPFGSKHVHRVTNNAVEPAASLHVYSPALVEMNSYVEVGERLRLVSSSKVGVNW
jgi:predicted metal-dependent enzyme (double-stranded beta helix superfamily)